MGNNMDKKRAFEESFKGYHKDAPAHLRSESKKLKMATKMRQEMLKRNDIGELLAYAQMRRKQKGGD